MDLSIYLLINVVHEPKITEKMLNDPDLADDVYKE